MLPWHTPSPPSRAGVVGPVSGSGVRPDAPALQRGAEGEAMRETRRASGSREASGSSAIRKGPVMGEVELERAPEMWQSGGRVHYVIEGGVPLRGDVHLSGAKNAVTKLMVASMLTEDTCTLHNAPRNLGDTSLTEQVMRALGSEVTWTGETSVTLRTSTIQSTVVPLELGTKNRLAVLTVGPTLHRTGHATIPAPGGDRIGPRPINFHLQGLEQMGVVVEDRDGLYYFHTNGLKGATIGLPFPSVMATETILIAATLARGVTVVKNAAIEPEIMDLIKFLQKMGAIIEQRVDRKIVIEGVSRLHGAEHRVLSDRNEAVSLAIAVYLTKGDVRLHGADQG